MSTRATPGPCPAGCILPPGHPWDECDVDGGAARQHRYYSSPAGTVLVLQEEVWSPLIGDSVLCDPFVELTDDLPGGLTVEGATVLAKATAQAAKICRAADRRWSA